MHKSLLIIIIFILTFSPLLGNDLKSKYLEYIHKKDFQSLESHLSIWEKSNPNDAELFIAYFNYYIYRNSNEAMVFNKDTSGDSAGTLYGKTFYNKSDVLKGIEYLDKGLELYPERLDMHIGKINILGEIEEYEKQKNHIIAVINLIPKYSNKWLWLDGKNCDNCIENLQSDIQKRVYNYININTKTSYSYVKSISEKMIQLYPKNIWWYNDLATVYFNDKDYQNALKQCKIAENINGKDEIVINNIAYCYEILNDKPNAIIYYKKLKNIGNHNLKQKADQKIIELQK
jgi:tetratricopeptide (TPR) repeat protein